jgi:D-alanine-D-alanine ligase
MKTLVLIVHNRVGDQPTEDEIDVILQRDAVKVSLEKLGFQVATLGISLDLGDARSRILEQKPACIFNLVESLAGDDRFAAAAVMLYESLHLPFTGSSSAALAITSNKCAAKKIMHAAAIPTPRWHLPDAAAQPPEFFPCIVKSATDHASIGIDDASVLHNKADWQRWVVATDKERRSGMFAEAYIHGREFNISFLQRSSGILEILPCAEIVFNEFPEGKPCIVGYAAKWEHETFEYQHTQRIFPSESNDAALRGSLVAVARSCWTLFSLTGYARVDFRVDKGNNVQVLEVNGNPCLSPDAGFFAACSKAGMTFDAMVNDIVSVALLNTRIQ